MKNPSLAGVAIAAYNLCFFAGVKAAGVATGVAYLLFSHALRHVSVATCVTLTLAEPVTAFVLAILVVGEQPGAAAFGGLGFVVSGLLLVVWGETRRRQG